MVIEQLFQNFPCLYIIVTSTLYLALCLTATRRAILACLGHLGNLCLESESLVAHSTHAAGVINFRVRTWHVVFSQCTKYS